MRFTIDGLPVYFPYDKIYPEQYAYMSDLKKALDAEGHCVLEMPSGTGKTVSLLSLIVAYQMHYSEKRKLIYCSRTVPEIEKALAELQILIEYRKSQGVEESFLGIGLTSRKNLCLHPTVSQQKWGKVVDAKCRNLTASWVRDKSKFDSNHDPNELLMDGVYTLEDLRVFGKEKCFCPYYLARRVIPFANVVIYSYHYLLDPKVAELVSKELSKNCIVVFDEAHNIDNVCIESLSIDLTKPNLDASARSIAKLSEKIDEVKAKDSERLKDEYTKLVEGLRAAREARDEDTFMSNPVLPDDLLTEAIPGNIRKAEHFIAFLRRFIEYIKTRMRIQHVVAETPSSFLQHLRELTFIEAKPLRFCSQRLTSLIHTLELSDLDEYYALHKVAAFATLVATYATGFFADFGTF
ncbi:23151_t:CDS:10 [Rhizophagus irregularis]|nr:23151_t:CDS:10 [Rhizophagus irregularis]